MARQRSPKRDKAFEIYKEHNGNILLKDIAKQLKISDVQIRKWKSNDKWEQKLKGTLKSNITKKFNREVKKQENEETGEILNNSNLTDKQKLFCIYYPKCFNATKAAIKAGYSKDTAYSIGFNLLKKVEIKTEIQRLKQNKLNRAMLSPDDIFQRYLDVAFSDMTDYAEFGKKRIKIGEKEDGTPEMIEINYVDFKDSKEVDGTLIQEVSKGKDGVRIKLQDKMKALDWVSSHSDLLTTEQKHKLEIERAKIKQQDNEQSDDVLKEMLEGLKNE
jgi:phage terminase small subunit